MRFVLMVQLILAYNELLAKNQMLYSIFLKFEPNKILYIYMLKCKLLLHCSSDTFDLYL